MEAFSIPGKPKIYQDVNCQDQIKMIKIVELYLYRKQFWHLINVLLYGVIEEYWVLVQPAGHIVVRVIDESLIGLKLW